jgi:ribosomal protein S18 acetylase RimI-like enzyme
VNHLSASSEPSRCSFVLEPSEERSEYVTNELREFNRPRKSPLWLNPPEPGAPLEVYALDDKGAVVGGLVGRTNEIPEWLEVSVVWVAGDKRGQGMGRRLMRLAEEEAKRRGCRYARLATGDYQAPDFYRKAGYKLYGELANCPRGETVYYFCKELVS